MTTDKIRQLHSQRTLYHYINTRRRRDAPTPAAFHELLATGPKRGALFRAVPGEFNRYRLRGLKPATIQNSDVSFSFLLPTDLYQNCRSVFLFSYRPLVHAVR